MSGESAFNERAAEYDAWFEENAAAYESELRAVRSLMPVSRRPVEVGVGTGRFAVPLGIGKGVEPSAAMAELARRRGVEVVPGVAEDLPFEDGSFDLVLIATTVCFIDDLRKALAEAYRVLEDGGFLIVAMLDRETELGRAYDSEKERSPYYSHARFRSSAEIIAALSEAGFGEPVSVQTVSSPPARMRQPEDPAPGTGTGLFAVLRARKKRVRPAGERCVS
ncbi:MAG: methyltransferase domain-containing protein [Candidatus Eisenbacteria bacterium]|nr:methyltransferase domain-containing protein [Candidatus Eisenbacteria bacterium]